MIIQCYLSSVVGAVIVAIGTVRQVVISRRLFWDLGWKCPHEPSRSCHLNNDVLVVCIRFVCARLLLRIVAELYHSARRKASHSIRVPSVNTDIATVIGAVNMCPFYLFAQPYTYASANRCSAAKPYPHLLFCLHYFANHHQSSRCSPIKRIANKNYMTSLS